MLDKHKSPLARGFAFALTCAEEIEMLLKTNQLLIDSVARTTNRRGAVVALSTLGVFMANQARVLATGGSSPTVINCSGSEDEWTATRCKGRSKTKKRHSNQKHGPVNRTTKRKKTKKACLKQAHREWTATCTVTGPGGGSSHVCPADYTGTQDCIRNGFSAAYDGACCSQTRTPGGVCTTGGEHQRCNGQHDAASDACCVHTDESREYYHGDWGWTIYV